jgi:hypothetical protein
MAKAPAREKGQTGTYDGIMDKRRGQEVEILGPGDKVTIPVKFPDGAVIGVNPRYIR